MEQAGQEAYRVLRDLVVEGIAAGRLRPGDPDESSLAAWSLVHGLAMLIIDGQVPAPLVAGAQRLRALTERVARLLDDGLVVRGKT
jgi:hypothetical protein